MRRALPMRFKYLIVYLRYGSLENFDQCHMRIPDIARRTNCHYSTVNMFLHRFRERGYQILPPQYKNSGRSLKIDGALREYLLGQDTLEAWTAYTLRRRCALIKKDWGVDIPFTTLFYFYRRHGIKNRARHYAYDKSLAPTEELVFNFARLLADVIRQKLPLIYVDESSVHQWMRLRKTWCSAEHPINVPIAEHRGQSTTIIGAIGNCVTPFFTVEDEGTTKEAFIRFLHALRPHCQVKKDEVVFLVLDQGKFQLAIITMCSRGAQNQRHEASHGPASLQGAAIATLLATGKCQFKSLTLHFSLTASKSCGPW